MESTAAQLSYHPTEERREQSDGPVGQRPAAILEDHLESDGEGGIEFSEAGPENV